MLPPERANLALLEDAEELRLSLERQLADLVEEDGAALAPHEQTVALAHRARERALSSRDSSLSTSAREGARS